MRNKFSVTYPDGTPAKAVPQRAAHVQEAIAASKGCLAAPDTKKTIVLPLYGIRIEDDGEKVVLTSCLRATNPHDCSCIEESNDLYNMYEAKVTMLEDVIQAHYKAGVKVTSKGYLKGIEDIVGNLKKHGG